MFRKLVFAFACATLAIPTLLAQTEVPGTRLSPPATSPEPKINQEQVDKEKPSPESEQPSREDWTTLSLAKSGLPMTSFGAVPLSKTETPLCTREILQVRWRPNDPIDLYVIRPRSVAQPPMALYLYNYTADTDIFRKDSWCELAIRSGIATVGFSSALSRQRFHAPRPMKQWFVSELQEALSSSTHDVQMILNYLDSRGDLDMKSVGMFAQGSGAGIAILAAAADSRITTLELIDPWGDWPDWLKGSKQIPEEERAAYLTPEFLQKVSDLDPVTYLPKLKLKALRIEQRMDDPVTPLTAKDKIAGVTPKPDTVIRYQNGATQRKAWRENKIPEWIGEQLRAPNMSKNERSGLGSALVRPSPNHSHSSHAI